MQFVGIVVVGVPVVGGPCSGYGCVVVLVAVAVVVVAVAVAVVCAGCGWSGVYCIEYIILLYDLYYFNMLYAKINPGVL